MIIDEPDSKQRAFLVVLNAINLSLIANTSTIKSVSDKLEKHLINFENHATEEEAMMNKGRGMWKVAAWVIGIAQVIGIAIWTDARFELREINRSITELVATDARSDTRLAVIEQKTGIKK